MTAIFSSYALDAMGFKDLVKKGSLAASFMSVTVYEVRGIDLPDNFAEARQARIAGTNYRIALSKSVNSGCQCLIGDDFTDSEIDWLEQVKSSGPFVLIAIGPTEFIECEAGRMKRTPDDSITTYDIFPGIRQTLKSMEERVLPPVVATLTLALNEPDRYVALRKLTNSTVGRTPDGTTVHDIRFDIRAQLTTRRALSEARAMDSLNASIERAPRLHQKAAQHFALGAAEHDQLKKFLYFFLTLEVETHAVFSHINHALKVQSEVLRNSTGSPRPSTADLITRDITKWTNLYDRFVWCANCAWPRLSDEDIKLFKELKNARDDIAHGKLSEPPAGFAKKAELLAHKVLWVADDSDV